MKACLVGGCVRDSLLGRPIKDRDWVVVGSTVEEMLSLGYEQVGAAFPVFLHPETREEYALARIDTKVGAGYHGFESYVAEDIPLEADLGRRDLTINSMARDPERDLIIDPYDGLKDLEDGILRHTTIAFREDPLRVVRLARFYARYQKLGFAVAGETMELCREMVANGELNELSDERMWLEMEKAFSDGNPRAFFAFLHEVEADSHVAFFKKLFPLVGFQSSTIMNIGRFCAIEDPAEAVDAFLMMYAQTNDLKWTKRSDLIKLRKAFVWLDMMKFTKEKSSECAVMVQAVFEMLRAYNQPSVLIDKMLRAMTSYRDTRRTGMLIKASLNAARAVSAADFPDLSGSDLGFAMRHARELKVQAVLFDQEQA